MPGTLEHIKTIYHKSHTSIAVTTPLSTTTTLALPGLTPIVPAAAKTSHRTEQVWVQDMAPMSLSNRLAVISSRTVTFYDLSSFEVACRITNLPNAPSAIECATVGDHQVLAFGDIAGFLHVYHLAEDFFFKDSAEPQSHIGIIGKERCDRIHSDWIVSVRYIYDLELLVTCSLDTEIQFYDPNKFVTLRTFRGHQTGVHAFDWCRQGKFIVSCGVSRSLKVWDPYTCNLMATLDGHVSPVRQVLVDDDNGRVISVSLDKMIKCWDSSTLRCIQTVVDETAYRPENRVNAMLFDSHQQMLVTAGNRLSMWHRRLDFTPRENRSHPAAVCAALYNSNFLQVSKHTEREHINGCLSSRHVISRCLPCVCTGCLWRCTFVGARMEY